VQTRLVGGPLTCHPQSGRTELRDDRPGSPIRWVQLHPGHELAGFLFARQGGRPQRPFLFSLGTLYPGMGCLTIVVPSGSWSQA